MDSMNVSVNATTLTELKAKVENAITLLAASGFKGGFSGNLNVHPIYENAPIGYALGEKQIAVPEGIGAAAESKPVEAPKKEKKAKKTETVEDVKLPEEAPLPSAVTETIEAVEEKSYTKEDIATALQTVSEKVNFQKAKEILSSYKKEDGSPCKKVSDFKVSDYASIMAEVEKAIA